MNFYPDNYDPQGAKLYGTQGQTQAQPSPGYGVGYGGRPGAQTFRVAGTPFTNPFQLGPNAAAAAAGGGGAIRGAGGSMGGGGFAGLAPGVGPTSTQQAGSNLLSALKGMDFKQGEDNGLSLWDKATGQYALMTSDNPYFTGQQVPPQVLSGKPEVPVDTGYGSLGSGGADAASSIDYGSLMGSFDWGGASGMGGDYAGALAAGVSAI